MCRKRAGTEVHEANGFAGDISEGEPEQEASRSQDIPVSSKRQKVVMAAKKKTQRMKKCMMPMKKRLLRLILLKQEHKE